MKNYVVVFDYNWDLIGYREINLTPLIKNNEIDRSELHTETERIAFEIVNKLKNKNFHCFVYKGDAPDSNIGDLAKKEYETHGLDIETWTDCKIIYNDKPIDMKDI
jgi:hypothetical protein